MKIKFNNKDPSCLIGENLAFFKSFLVMNGTETYLISMWPYLYELEIFIQIFLCTFFSLWKTRYFILENAHSIIPDPWPFFYPIQLVVNIVYRYLHTLKKSSRVSLKFYDWRHEFWIFLLNFSRIYIYRIELFAC